MVACFGPRKTSYFSETNIAPENRPCALKGNIGLPIIHSSGSMFGFTMIYHTNLLWIYHKKSRIHVRFVGWVFPTHLKNMRKSNWSSLPPPGFLIHPRPRPVLPRGTAKKSPPVCPKAAGVAVVIPYNLETNNDSAGAFQRSKDSATKQKRQNQPMPWWFKMTLSIP